MSMRGKQKRAADNTLRQSSRILLCIILGILYNSIHMRLLAQGGSAGIQEADTLVRQYFEVGISEVSFNAGFEIFISCFHKIKS